MNIDELQAHVREQMKQVAFNPKSLHDPMVRCTDFLTTMAMLNDFIFTCRCDLARLQTVTEALFKDAIDHAEGKTVTEKKIGAAAHPEYTNAKEASERIEAMIKWAKTALDIFNNAHVTYRQTAREG